MSQIRIGGETLYDEVLADQHLLNSYKICEAGRVM